MKKIIMIIGALLLSAGCLTAQDSPTQDTATHGYRSFFGSESTVWNCAVEMYDIGPIDRTFTFSGDTVINGTAYKKVHQSSNTGLAREDTIFGKLWIKWRYEDSEELVVDMSLSVGDSFDIGFRGWYIVDSVYFDSDGRKTIHLVKPGSPSFYMKEGIGAELMWNDFFSAGQMTSYLICVFHNNTHVYTTNVTSIDGDNGSIIRDSCRVRPRLTIKDIYTDDPVIYPNPFHQKLIVDIPELQLLQMYDTKGRLIVETIENEVNMAIIPAGMYIAIIKANDKKTYKKIIKK